MRRTNSPYLTDFLVISLRWLALFGLALALGAQGALAPGEPEAPAPLFLILSLAALALWNGVTTGLAIFGQRPFRAQVYVALDVIFTLLVWLAASGFRREIFWVGLMPAFSASFSTSALGVLATAVLVSALQAGVSLAAGDSGAGITIGLAAGFNLLASGISVWLSAPLLNTLRSAYQDTLNGQQEGVRQAQREEHERMRALFTILETLSSSLNYQKVIETIVETAIAALGEAQSEAGRMIGCVLLFGKGQNLEVHAAQGFAAPDLAVQLPARDGILYETLKSGEAHVLNNPENDAELNALATLRQCQSVVCLPLIRGFRAFGVMLFAHPSPDFFTSERVEILQMLGHQAAIALQNAQLYQDLTHEKEHIVEIQEETEKKLARDLHDGPTQSISAIAMRIEIVRKLLELVQKRENPSDLADSLQEIDRELKQIEELAQHTTEEIRNMLFTLRPLALETEGLEAALKMMAEKTGELFHQKVTINIQPGIVEWMDSSQQAVVFYLADEAVNNACKHAHASEIQVSMKLAPNENDIALLEIADNGVGFDLQAVMSSYERRGSLGMVNLRERTEMINGVLKIESAPGQGTRVKTYIPLDEQAISRLSQFE